MTETADKLIFLSASGLWIADLEIRKYLDKRPEHEALVAYEDNCVQEGATEEQS